MPIPKNPTKKIPFGIYGEGEPSLTTRSVLGDPEDELTAVASSDASFRPIYYPSNFSIVTDKELIRNGAKCEGERISIDKLKNSEIHVNGLVHQQDLDSLDKLAHTTKPVTLISPIVPSGGMEVIVKKAERGDYKSWDAYVRQRMFEYTIDMVSTGADEWGK
jgi:hypothetical protein